MFRCQSSDVVADETDVWIVSSLPSSTVERVWELRVVDQAQVVGVCPQLDEVPIVICLIIAPVCAVAIEVANHHPSIIVDNFAWAEAHGWWFIDGSDSNSLKVGSKELNVVDSTR